MDPATSTMSHPRIGDSTLHSHCCKKNLICHKYLIISGIGFLDFKALLAYANVIKGAYCSHLRIKVSKKGVKVIGYKIGELQGWSTGGGDISWLGPLGMV